MIICGKCLDDGRTVEGRRYLLHVQEQDACCANFTLAIPVTMRADLCADHAGTYLEELRNVLERFIPASGDAVIANLPSVPTAEKPAPTPAKGKRK